MQIDTISEAQQNSIAALTSQARWFSGYFNRSFARIMDPANDTKSVVRPTLRPVS